MGQDILLRPKKGSAIPGLITVGARCTTTTNGTLAAGTELYGLVSVVKTGGEVGRYTLTLPRASVKFWKGTVTLIGPDDAALTTTKGLVAVFRDDDIASDGTIELQFAQTNAGNADTELQDGMKFNVELELIDTLAV